MIKVGILTTFREDDEAYSLCNVVNDQLKMLVNGGYEPVLFVTKDYKPGRMSASKKVEIRELPDQIRQNEVNEEVLKKDQFWKDVKILEDAMTDAMQDIDVLITHDIIYQPDAIKHNIALRSVRERGISKLKFLHWIHSATSPYSLMNLRGSFRDEYRNVVREYFPNSFYVFFNEWSRPRIARDFDIPENIVRIVHHPTDYFKFAKYEKYTKKLIREYNLLNADFINVYPIRLDRGKQVEVPIKALASLKRFGFSVRVIVVDFHSSSDDPNDDKYKYRQDLKEVGIDWGLNEGELIFTSEFLPESKVRVPSGVVSDLFDLSNIFIMSSMSESYSLITQEAAMKGNLLVLNRNFPPFRDIFGPQAIHWPFDSNVSIPDIADGHSKVGYGEGGEKADFENLAKEIVANTYAFNKQNVTRRRILRERTIDSVFRRELEPIINEIVSREKDEKLRPDNLPV